MTNLRVLPFNSGSPPTLAVDAVTGAFFLGEHQLVLSSLLARMADAANRPVDPRFIAEPDLDLFDCTANESFGDAVVPLRPMFMRSLDGRGLVGSIKVGPAEFVDGLPDWPRRPPVTIRDLTPKGDESAILSPDDCEPTGTISSAIVTGVKHGDEAIVVSGMAMWMVHGMTATSLSPDMEALVLAASRIAESNGVIQSKMCALANEAQSLARSSLDALIRLKTNSERDILTLDDRVALEHEAPWPDLHRAEANCWLARNLRRSAIEPWRLFADKSELCAQIATGAMKGNADDRLWRDRWLDAAHAKSAIEFRISVMIDWEVAMARSEESLRRRLDDDDDADGSNDGPLLSGLGRACLPNGRSAKIEVLESTHDFDVGELLIGLNDTRTRVVYMVALLHAPLGRGSLRCNGVDWSPLANCDGAVWHDPEPSRYDSMIGDDTGTNLHIVAVREYRAPREEYVRRDAEERAFATRTFDVMAAHEEVPEATGRGLSPLVGNIGGTGGGRMLVLASGWTPVAAAILIDDWPTLRNGDKVAVRVGRAQSEWLGVELPDVEKVVLMPPAADCIAVLRSERVLLELEHDGKPLHSIVHLDPYAPIPPTIDENDAVAR